jgi:hypothetical protein
MYMHLDRQSILQENLSQLHASDFAGFYVSVGDHKPFRPVHRHPALMKAFLLGCLRLNKDETLPWYFDLDAAAERLPR